MPVFGWAVFSGGRHAPTPCSLDAPNVMLTSSGRAAILLALRGLGVGAGDRVLVPTYHCRTMITPVVALGAEPHFFSIDDAGTPRLDLIATQDLSRVRAMIAAHYFGLPQPMATIRRFCDEHSIALIEDCAHAMFGLADGRPMGSWGDYSIASLTKFLPVTDGGCLASWRRSIDEGALNARSLTDELKSAANAIETGATYERFPGINRILVAIFALANACRKIPGPT